MPLSYPIQIKIPLSVNESTIQEMNSYMLVVKAVFQKAEFWSWSKHVHGLGEAPLLAEIYKRVEFSFSNQSHFRKMPIGCFIGSKLVLH